MLAEHPRHPLHWFEPAAHGPLSPRLQKGSCPKHRFVVPEVIKAFLEIPRPACGHLARQQTLELDPGLPPDTAAPPQQLPTHFLELGRKRFTPQPRALGSTDLVPPPCSSGTQCENGPGCAGHARPSWL